MTADNVEKFEEFPSPNETLYEFVTRLANGASDRALLILIGSCVTIGTAFALIWPRLWPVAAICGTISCIALWGILEHQRLSHPNRWLGIVERIVAVTGCIAAFAATMGALYLALGHGWIS
jgi:hypothetical protein